VYGPPLSLRRNFLLCSSKEHNTTARLTVHFFYPTSRNRYGLNIGAPRPLGVHFHHLLDYLDICLPHIIPSRLSRVRPWCVMHLSCDFRFVQYAIGVTAVLTYHRHFAVVLSACPEYTPVLQTGRLFRAQRDVHSCMKTKFSPDL
jgi:hypothetical protein